MGKDMGSLINSVVSVLIKRLKGEAFEVDERVPATALLFILVSRAVNLLRGMVRCLGMTSSRMPVVFMEKGVILRNKRFIRLGRGVSIGLASYIDGLSEDGVNIGNNVSFGAYARIICTGSLNHIGKGCSIGDSSGMGEYVFIGAAGGVEIGKNVIIGQSVSFHAENHNFDRTDVPIRLQGVNHKGIVVEDDCWIGANVTLLDGARVGTGSIIGAGSVVRGDVPPYSIAAGIPAKVIRSRK